jgi:hypothetical protein
MTWGCGMGREGPSNKKKAKNAWLEMGSGGDIKI